MKPQQAAQIMYDLFKENGFLYQETAAMELADFESEGLSYYDDSGSLCVGKAVLKEFNLLTPECVYERSGKFWRERLETDEPGRQQ